MNGAADRELAERVLGHPVTVTIPAGAGWPLVAGSTAGDPLRGRAAWLDPDGTVLARIAAPGGTPSRGRPVVASALSVDLPDGRRDQIVLALASAEAGAVRAEVAGDAGDQPAQVEVADGGLALIRIDPDTSCIAVDALDRTGEPIGRLARAGIGELRLEGGRLAGRLGASHGMAAGLGAGRWVRDLEDAALEAGYRPVLPGWIPPGLEAGPPWVEPEVAYPSAPPAVVSVWRGEGSTRVLLRQTPAPLAQPEHVGPRARAVEIGPGTGVLRARGIVLLVWETPERAFGLQVRGLSGGVEAALRIARSVP
jgi:hypothetical protein